MRVVVPFAGAGKPHPLTVASLDAQAPGRVKYVDVSGDRLAYWRLLCELWADDSSDLLVIEHDLELMAGTLASLDDCPAAWCSVPSDYAIVMRSNWPTTPPTVHGNLEAALQVNRWRAEVLRANSDLLSELPVAHRAWQEVARFLRPLSARIGGPHHHGGPDKPMHWSNYETRRERQRQRLRSRGPGGHQVIKRADDREVLMPLATCAEPGCKSRILPFEQHRDGLCQLHHRLVYWATQRSDRA